MANADASFWGRKEGASASVRADYLRELAYDQSCNQRGRHATIQTELATELDQFSNRDCRSALARAVLPRPQQCGIPASWH
jgi:hypothetical protein